jgi:GLPGLI family protein
MIFVKNHKIRSMITRTFFTLAIVLGSLMNLIAQPFEGKITFSISFPTITDPQTAAMLPKEATAFFKKGKSRMEMNMAMGMKQTTISDAETKKTVMLMDMMGQKYAIVSDMEDDSDKEAKELADKAKVNVTSETKKIAGFNCKKAIVTYQDPNQDNKEVSMTLWFTEELEADKGYMTGPMSKIKGAVLEYSIDQGVMSMVLSATSVTKEAVADQLFVAPPEYKQMTQEELQKMMGGR